VTAICSRNLNVLEAENLHCAFKILQTIARRILNTLIFLDAMVSITVCVEVQMVTFGHVCVLIILKTLRCTTLLPNAPQAGPRTRLALSFSSLCPT